MNPLLKEFLLKLVYAVVGVSLATAIAFLNQNPAVFAGSASLIVAILSVIEQKYFTPSA